MPAGCLTFVVLVIGFVLLIAMLVFGAMKSTDVYKTALAAARDNPEVVEALGTPIKDGMFVTGKTNVDGASGEATFAIPISGPKGSGTLYVTATKSAGRWEYQTLEVQIGSSNERIPLENPGEPAE